MEELIERVKASEKTKAVWRKDPKSTEWQEASKLNKILVGIPLNSSARCECIEDLFFLLKRENINQKISEKMEKKFILKAGKLIQSADFENIGKASSDESMINALKRSPALIVHFKQVPENWKEICGIEEKDPSEEGDSNKENVFVLNTLRIEREEKVKPFAEFLTEEEKALDLASLSNEGFDALLKGLEVSFNEEQEKQLGNQSKEILFHVVTEEDLVNNPDLVAQGVKVGDQIEIQANETIEGNEEGATTQADKTATFQAKFTFEELDKLKISGLRAILTENKKEIPANVSRKAELIDFILKTL